VVTKPKVSTHASRCGSNAFSCVDCNQVFRAGSWNSHTNCISEAEKYQGALFKGKKGQQNNTPNKTNNGTPPKLIPITQTPPAPTTANTQQSKPAIHFFNEAPKTEVKTTEKVTKTPQEKQTETKNTKKRDISSVDSKAEDADTSNGKKQTTKPNTKKPKTKKPKEKPPSVARTNFVESIKFRKLIRLELQQAPKNELKVKKLRKRIVKQIVASVKTDLKAAFPSKMGEAVEVDGKVAKLKKQ